MLYKLPTKDLNVKNEIIKVLEETQKNLLSWHKDDFLRLKNTGTIKERVTKIYSIK